MPVEKNIDIENLAKKLEGYSGAEVCLICRQAGLNALSKSIHSENISQEDFELAIKKIKPRIT